MVKAIKEVYKCALCGNIVEVMHKGGGTLVCCGQEMALLAENSVDASKEKHVPVMERNGDKITVKVGSVAHPMDPDHYIEWIELVSDSGIRVKFLNPGDKPEALFCCATDNAYVRAYCNKHGLWKN
jgi:superoxide reductase